MAGLSTAYLTLYNTVLAIGWSACLVKLVSALLQAPGDLRVAYAAAAPLNFLCQGATILDVVHAATGLVPSNPAMGLLQWIGRSNVLYLVLARIPEVQATPPAIAMLLVWAVSEVIRYPWYALTGLKLCPAWLTWLRYTAFIPLYPVGVVGEMLVLWKALPQLQALQLYSVALPNAANFAFRYDVFVRVGLLLYVPMWWNLYSGLLRQRRKKLGLRRVAEGSEAQEGKLKGA